MNESHGNARGFGRRPIAVLDSGVGGLSVLREIRRELSREDLLYLADQAHIPYGPRPLAEIRRLTVAITHFLLEHGAKCVVVACNTASSAALHHLRATFPDTPFVGMEPAVKPAVAASQSHVIGVIATPATVSGEMFAGLVDRYAEGATVLPQVCPGLVERVEGGDLDGAETMQLLHAYLDPLLREGMDTLVLGCTHYPFLLPAVRQLVGPDVQVIDPSPAVARQVRRVCEANDWLNRAAKPGALKSYTTGDAVAFAHLATRLVGDAGRVRALRWNAAASTLSEVG